jgi:sulfopyruvate decarboxylase subunit alpha
VCVPDTNLKTAIAALHAPDMPTMLYACTEDEAMGINAGLYISGHRPLMLIQNNGLYACINTLKAIALDAGIPTCMVIGEYGRDAGKASEENISRQVRMLHPTLRVWEVGAYPIEGLEDLDQLDAAWQHAWDRKTATAAVIGAATI